ncbi:ABC transporter substrate-binding protein [Micromonospora tarensis]|uniref:ABC transporter substrate-binding protein n=1 Tax=Micromonospora tarensis TaxID=2806100 RepID=A0ABS1YGQ7_9ACTN|nr:ABC transporter substrate-binding protein [Micromonospora tarensis]MBM0276620.1 ABC transporter substrate-binding protein [Micromonospora tarensis]
MKKVMALGLIAATAIALSGCTDSDASSPSDQASDGLRKVRVAALPITETAALWGGIKAGIFAERGLQVEVLPAQGGAQAIPALLNGDIDFAIGQPFGPFRATCATSASSSSATTPPRTPTATTSTPWSPRRNPASNGLPTSPASGSRSTAWAPPAM